MAGLTDKQKQLDIDKDGEIEASDLKALRTGNTTTKEGRMREKISKLVELMTQKELKEYQRVAKLTEADSNKNRVDAIHDVFDDFYLITDNLITQHYGTSDMAKFREMSNLLFLKYQEKLENILK